MLNEMVAAFGGHVHEMAQLAEMVDRALPEITSKVAGLDALKAEVEESSTKAALLAQAVADLTAKRDSLREQIRGLVADFKDV